MAEIAALVLALAAIAAVGIYTLLTGVPPTPTSPRVQHVLLDLVPRDLRGTVVELGSGFGGLARALAKHCPQATVVGYERSPLPWLISALRQLARPLPNLRLVRGDFRRASLDSTALIVCYLARPVMAELAPHFASRLAPGTLVLCNTFSLPDWHAVATHPANDLYRTQVFLYRTPESLPR